MDRIIDFEVLLSLWLHQMHMGLSPADLLVINPRRACAARVTVVGSVCVSVKSNLTPGASVRPENTVTYSAGNGDQKFVGFSLKQLRSIVMASFAYPRHPTKYCSDIPRTFSTVEPSKGPKKANNRLNTTWNTTR